MAKLFFSPQRHQDTEVPPQRGSAPEGKNNKLKWFESLCLGGKCYGVCFEVP
jgi:hypothetical protein